MGRSGERVEGCSVFAVSDVDVIAHINRRKGLSLVQILGGRSGYGAFKVSGNNSSTHTT